MAIFVEVTIECDKCGERQELGDASDEMEGAESALERGWDVAAHDTKDLCPNCKPRYK